MNTIEVFADVCCPFTYVGLRRIVARRAELGDDSVIRVRAWPLELVNGRPLDARLISEEIAELRAQVAPDLFSGFDPRAFPSSSLPAMVLVAAASREDAALGERVGLEVRRLLFEEGRDISDPDVLRVVAQGLGVPAITAADERAPIEDWSEGADRGVIGSPHFFAPGHDWFCPTLSIERVDGRLRISGRADEFDAFVDELLGRPAPHHGSAAD